MMSTSVENQTVDMSGSSDQAKKSRETALVLSAVHSSLMVVCIRVMSSVVIVRQAPVVAGAGDGDAAGEDGGEGDDAAGGLTDGSGCRYSSNNNDEQHAADVSRHHAYHLRAHRPTTMKHRAWELLSWETAHVLVCIMPCCGNNNAGSCKSRIH